MAKSWQEIEFLDYKERQVRRRSQRTRALESVAVAGDRGGEGRRLLRLALGGAVFLALLAGGIFGY
ncbi:MAG: hypothetical protein HY814_14130, partial [Candidatus Riflebacteria bacterium]|nr:hypothetical protein [Candidatus Riflebacteria bacterium]